MVSDYNHLWLHRSVLHTPEGDIHLTRIGQGTFATVYRGSDGRVYAFTPDDVFDKEIAREAKLDGNPHVPDVELFGHTADKTVWVMPWYKTPLRKSDSPEAWQEYLTLKDCREESWRHEDKGGYPVNYRTVECAKEAGVPPAVADALESLMSTAANYDYEYLFEFSPRNLATDEKGNLVFLDVLFHRELAERAHRAAARRSRGRR